MEDNHCSELGNGQFACCYISSRSLLTYNVLVLQALAGDAADVLRQEPCPMQSSSSQLQALAMMESAEVSMHCYRHLVDDAK